MRLKSTGQVIHLLPWTATAVRPWGNEYERVIIPSETIGHKHRVEVVKKTSINSK